MIFFSNFSQKTDFDVSCQLPPGETVCVKCQILCSGKNKKNIVNMSSAELANRVLKVKAGLSIKGSKCTCQLVLIILFSLLNVFIDEQMTGLMTNLLYILYTRNR